MSHRSHRMIVKEIVGETITLPALLAYVRAADALSAVLHDDYGTHNALIAGRNTLDAARADLARGIAQ